MTKRQLLLTIYMDEGDAYIPMAAFDLGKEKERDAYMERMNSQRDWIYYKPGYIVLNPDIADIDRDVRTVVMGRTGEIIGQRLEGCPTGEGFTLNTTGFYGFKQIREFVDGQYKWCDNAFVWRFYADGDYPRQLSFMRDILMEISVSDLWGKRDEAFKHFNGRFYED